MSFLAALSGSSTKAPGFAGGYLLYLAISDKVIEGSPQNAISTVPVMPWGSGR